MRRALFCAFLTVTMAGGIGLAQTKKGSSAKPAGRPEMLIPPLRSPTAPAIEAHRNPYNMGNVQYPRIEADSRVTFRLNAPDARKVQVSIVNVPHDMVKGADGVWTYTSEPQAPGYHNYWMIVDGAVVVDPGTDAFIGYSHMCNGFEIPEPGVDFYDLKDVPHGNVLIKNYYAKSIKQWRRIYVYTPPGYDANIRTRYPVLYLQHGGGEDQRVWTEMGRAHLILDNMIAAGQAKPFIIVMETSAIPGQGGGRGTAPAGGQAGAARGAAPGAAPAAGTPGGAAGRGGAFGIGGPQGGAYGQLMVNDLIPWVDANFRTMADQAHRAMSGLSMGGMQTASVTMANLDKFSHIGLFSGGASAGGGRGRGAAPGAAAAAAPAAPDFKTIYNGQMADPASFNKKVKVFFFSCGSEENEAGLRSHQEQLIAHGIKNSYVYISPGTAHEFQTWRRSLYAFASLLFR